MWTYPLAADGISRFSRATGVPSHVVRPDPMLARLDGLIARMKTYGGTDEQVQDLILSAVQNPLFSGFPHEYRVRECTHRNLE